MTGTELPDQKSGGNSAGDLKEKKIERRIKYLDLFIKFLVGGGITILIWYWGARQKNPAARLPPKRRKPDTRPPKKSKS